MNPLSPRLNRTWIEAKNHEYFEKTFGNCPSTAEITSEKESDKFTTIKAI